MNVHLTTTDLRSVISYSEGAHLSRGAAMHCLRRPLFDQMLAAPGQKHHRPLAAAPGQRNHTEEITLIY